MTEDYGENRADTDEAIREMDLIARQELGKRRLNGHPLYDDMRQEAVVAAWRASQRVDSASGAYHRRAASWRIDTLLQPGKSMLGNEGSHHKARTVPASPLPEDDSMYSPLDELVGADAVDFTERAYMRGALVQAISELPPKQRAYVVRRFWGGEEASKTLAEDFSHSTWERARAYLRPRLRELLEVGA